jgi:8-hydroxy-5-deazaflavin:NADPH oxidoreductase
MLPPTLATDEDLDCDILVFGDDKSARNTVIELVRACRLRGLHGDRTYSVDGAGIRITGNLAEAANAQSQ